MRLVSIGDLVTDFYYKDNRLIGVNGGMSSHNIIFNLAYMGNNTSVIGACGNDASGNLAIKSLNDIGVDTSNIKVINNIKTRCFHVSDKTKKRCPLCREKYWYVNSLIDVKKALDLIKNDDILVFDNLNKVNQEIINKTKNIKLLDQGQYFEFESISDKEVIAKLNNFTLVNLNKRVADYLMKRFNLNMEDLSALINSSLLTITDGKKGVYFVSDKIYEFKLDKPSKEIDSNGAGDAFFASIINSWLKNDMKIDPSMFKKWFDDATKLTSTCVKNIGARGHISKLYKVRKVKEYCYCNTFEISVRKKVQWCHTNVINLKDRVIKGINSSALEDLNNIDFKSKENYLFVGSGGSLAPAKMAEMIVNHYIGSNGNTLLPRDVLSRNNDNIDKMFLFSYSGVTRDTITISKGLDKDKEYIITKGDKDKVIEKTGIDNIVSYRADTARERGFLSFEGAIVPSCLFLKRFGNLDIVSFVLNSIDYWDKYFTNQFSREEIKNIFLNGNVINIFSGDYSIVATTDLESKLTESSLYSCVVHEKKNFSHGRYTYYENRSKNTIYFKQKSTSKYEKTLLSYLNRDLLLVESRYDGIYSALDLLIASQYLVYHLDSILDVDMSEPVYNKSTVRRLYSYKGDL